MYRSCPGSTHFSLLLLLGLGRLQHCLLLLFRQFLEAVLFLDSLLLFHALLRLLLCLQTLLLLFSSAFHATLGKCLVAHKFAVHARHRHLTGTTCTLDTIAMILVDLVVVGVVLGLRHDSWQDGAAQHKALESE